MLGFARDKGGPALRAMGFHDGARMLKALAEYDIDFAEQPVHWTNLDGMARIRAAVPMPSVRPHPGGSR